MSAATDAVEVTLTIVETIHYGADFTVGELNELCRKHGIPEYDPDGETGDLKAWLMDVAYEAIEKEPGMLERIEHESGDVQGQEWQWEAAR